LDEEDAEDSEDSEDLDSDSDSEGGEAPPSWGDVTAETLLRDEETGKALRAEQARIEAQDEAVWAQDLLKKAHEARASPDLRKVFTKYELTGGLRPHGVNNANLAECIRRVRTQIAQDGGLTVERSVDLGLLRSAIHEDLL
jgi:hypothetical protein